MLYIKTLETIRAMVQSGRLLYNTLELLKSEIRPGITTKELNKIAHRYIISNGADPTFLGYGGFPGSICTSKNEVVIHGIPSSECVLEEGDIISLDVGVHYKGVHTDAARTFAVGNISKEKQQLIDVCRGSFYAGMKQAVKGNRISDIGHAVEEYVKPYGYGIVRDFTGHGVGIELHESPSIPNYGKPGHGLRICDGMTLAIEPMINLGRDEVRILSDDWKTVTVDCKASAHYENTIAIVDGGPVILTAPDVSI